jgi:hypothetical protein
LYSGSIPFIVSSEVCGAAADISGFGRATDTLGFDQEATSIIRQENPRIVRFKVSIPSFILTSLLFDVASAMDGARVLKLCRASEASRENALLTCSAAFGEAKLGASFATIGAKLVTKAESGRTGC